MAIDILREPSMATAMGQSTGTGLGEALSGLAEWKLGQLKQRSVQQKTSKGLQAVGFTKEQADQISQMPEFMQDVILKNNYKSLGRPDTQTGIAQLLSRLLEQQMPMPGVNQEKLEEPAPVETQNTAPISARKAAGNKKLNNAVIDAFLRASKNDPVKARELARRYGYEV